MTAQEVFQKTLKSKNLMTPKVVEYGWLRENQIAYELSIGQGIKYKPIFGVTILKRIGNSNKWESLSEFNQCFRGQAAKNDAICYIVQLKNWEVY